MAKQTKVTAQTLATGFLSVGKELNKIAPMVRAYIGTLTGEKLEAAKKAAYDAIREKAGRNDKGQLIAADKLPAEIRAAYDAARTAISRAIRKRDNAGKGPVVKLTAPQKAYNAAFDAKASLQKMENCPVDLIAAFDAVLAKAVTLGATAKVAK